MAVETILRPSSPYETSLRALLQTSSPTASEPSWLTTRRQDAKARFEAQGFPTRKLEAWRYIELGQLLAQNYETYQPENVSLDEALISPYLLPEAANSRLVFINGIFSSALSRIEGLASGITLSPIQKALTENAGVIESHFEARLASEEDAFAAINTALFEDGAAIYFADNTQSQTPIQILFLSRAASQAKVSYPRLLLVAGADSQVTVAVSSVTLADDEAEPVLVNLVAELSVAERAQVSYTYIQEEAHQAYHFATTRAVVAEKARLEMVSCALGGRQNRHNLFVSLNGMHAECCLNGLSLLDGLSQVFDHTVICHTVPECNSEQTYKGILNGSARSEFDGTIVIPRDSQLSNATQLNRTLLLSDSARVVTRPQLRIEADDVKCAHGATVGQLEAEPLFYLTSRGLSVDTAKSLLTYGFAEEIIGKIPVPSLQKYLTRHTDEIIREKQPTSFFKP